MDLKINPNNFLKHLQNLTESFKYNDQDIYYINVYSQKQNGKYVPIAAPGEGIACVDDSARAVILALEIYESFADKESLEQAEKWLTFLEYMQDISPVSIKFTLSCLNKPLPESFKFSFNSSTHK